MDKREVSCDSILSGFPITDSPSIASTCPSVWSGDYLISPEFTPSVPCLYVPVYYPIICPSGFGKSHRGSHRRSKNFTPIAQFPLYTPSYYQSSPYSAKPVMMDAASQSTAEVQVETTTEQTCNKGVSYSRNFLISLAPSASGRSVLDVKAPLAPLKQLKGEDAFFNRRVERQNRSVNFNLQIQSLLNKVAPDNFERIGKKIKAILEEEEEHADAKFVPIFLANCLRNLKFAETLIDLLIGLDRIDSEQISLALGLLEVEDTQMEHLFSLTGKLFRRKMVEASTVSLVFEKTVLDCFTPDIVKCLVAFLQSLVNSDGSLAFENDFPVNHLVDAVRMIRHSGVILKESGTMHVELFGTRVELYEVEAKEVCLCMNFLEMVDDPASIDCSTLLQRATDRALRFEEVANSAQTHLRTEAEDLNEWTTVRRRK